MKRPLLLALHRYIGLTTGIFFLVTAVTGGLLLYKHPILFTYYPELQAARAEAEQVRDDNGAALLNQLWSQRQESPLLRVRYPESGWPFYTVSYLNGELAYYTPAGEKLVSSTGYDNPITLIFDIHHEWLAGEAGELASGYIHLAVLVLLVLGIYAWWPRSWRKSLHLVLRGNAVKVNYSWHRVIGAVSALVLILAVGTGVMMVFYSQAQTVLTATFGGGIAPVNRTIEVGERALPWPQLQKAMEDSLPEGRTRLVSFPTTEDQALVIRKRMPQEWHQNGRSFIYVNPYTAEVYSARDAMQDELGDRLTQKIYPLHSAGVGGTAFVALLTVSGFAPLILVPTGFYVWWWRRKKRSRIASTPNLRRAQLKEKPSL